MFTASLEVVMDDFDVQLRGGIRPLFFGARARSLAIRAKVGVALLGVAYSLCSDIWTRIDSDGRQLQSKKKAL